MIINDNEKKKKIAIIHHCGVIGGAGRSLLQTVNMLSDEYDVTVYCPENSGMSDFLLHNNVNVKQYNFSLGSVPYYSGGPRILSRTFWKEIFYIFKNKSKRLAMLRQSKADVIMLNSVTESFILKEIKKQTTASAVCFVRETLPRGSKGYFFRLFKKYFEKHGDGVFFISDFDRRAYALNICNAVTIKNTVPDDFFEPYEDTRAEYLTMLNVERAPEENDYYLLFMGGDSQLKGYSTICKAMEYLPQNVRLLLAGGHISSRNKLLALIAARTEVLGMLEDISNAYKACDLVIFPAIKPHQGRPIFEAGAFGKAAVASDFEELKEDIRDGVNGAVFIPGDAKDLALKISEIIENNYKGMTASALAENNRLLSKDNHSIPAVRTNLKRGIVNAISTKEIEHLHIMTASNYATVDGYTKLINNNFDNEKHFFIIRDTADNPKHSLEKYKNILWLPDAEYSERGTLFAYLKRAKKIYWHSMNWYWTTQLRLLMKPSIMKKSTWVEWGADLFDWKHTDGNPITRHIVNAIHKKWRSSVASVVAIFPTDEKVYKNTFSKKVPVKHATYSVYHHSRIDEQKPETPKTSDTINILVGHSATPDCYHFDVLNALAQYKDEDIMLYIPLSYGDKEYAEKVNAKALSIFGTSKVHFILENMPLWDYVHFLWSIDIGIFKVYRQIALGNICRLLYMTKKVYLPAGSILYDYYKENGTEIYDCDKISEMSFAEFTKAPIMTEPSQCIKDIMTQEKVIEQWRNVFNG